MIPDATLLDTGVLDVIDAYVVPVFFGLLAVDLAVRSRGFARAYSLPDSLCSISMGVFYALAAAAARTSVLVVFGEIHRAAPLRLGFDGGPLVWLAAFVGVDFAFYWFHRALHEVRIGWAAHVNHHSSTHYNYATALRQSLFEPLVEPFFMTPLVLIGFDPVLVLACLALNFAYQFWPHTEFGKGLRAMGVVLVTPSHHRVHHARNVQYLDKNYGGTLIVWDKLFATFEPEGQAPDYGITHNLTTHNPLRATFHEWIAMARDVMAAHDLPTRLGYALRPPGWTPTGAGETSRERQKRYRAQQDSN